MEISKNYINSQRNKANEDIERIRLLKQNNESGFLLKMDNEDPHLNMKKTLR